MKERERERMIVLLFSPLLTSELTRILLEHFIKQIECPSYLIADQSNKSANDNGSLFKLSQTVANSFWSVVTLGMSSSITTDETQQSTVHSPIDNQRYLLAHQSIHLLLILSNHFTNDVHRNPYRLALLHFTDTLGN